MKIKVNERYEYDIQADGEAFMVDGEALEINARKLANQHTHVLYKNKSYNVELVSENRAEKTCTYKVNGTLYNISIEDQYDQLLMQLGMDNALANKVREIKAPMPGLVLNILAGECAEVNKGDNLLVLEAMKMENIIKSPAQGKIKKVFVNKGDKVEKNQILIQFD